MLPKILPEFKFLVLDVVKREIPMLLLAELNRIIERDKSIQEEAFGKTAGEIKEFARLTASNGMALGKGESACMVYCRYHHDVVAAATSRISPITASNSVLRTSPRMIFCIMQSSEACSASKKLPTSLQM